MEVILFQPEIPQNTGNIARTCAVTGACLTLVTPLGFSITSKHVKRAGLDYWTDVELNTIDNLEEHLLAKRFPFYFFSTKGKKPYTEIAFTPESTLIFGAETTGLPQTFHEKWPEYFYTIPMKPSARSLNLSNAVAIILYEAFRQQNFNFAT